MIGSEAAQALVTTNPQAILDNKVLTPNPNKFLSASGLWDVSSGVRVSTLVQGSWVFLLFFRLRLLSSARIGYVRPTPLAALCCLYIASPSPF